MAEITERFVDSSDGVRVAVYEEGNPAGPTVVLIHGWPDSHVLWDGVAPLLTDRFRVIRYDNRGVGKTSVPKSVSAYTMAAYADDFAAVIDAVVPGEPVHVLAHDWGSAGMWEYLSRPSAGDHVASFTSVSGPSGDHMNRFIVGGLKRPYRPRRFLQALDQLLRFSYMAPFSIPVLAPLVVRTFLADGWRRMLMIRDGIPADRLYHSDTYRSDAANSLKVYRANYFKTIRSARTDHYVGVPDIVVNNAGVGHAGLFLETPRDEFDRVLAINFGGVVNCCRSFGRRLVDRGTGGHIVNISSMAAYSPQQSMNAYATSKAAVFMFGDCLRAELDQAGVGLTTVCPGVINTNIVHTTRFDVPAGKQAKVEARRAQLEKAFAVRRYGPDKVAKAIVSAVKKNKPIRPVAPEAYFVYGVAHLLPQVMRSSARASVM
jgi:NAD(P)-dependent dehydrogenase (short-subunit alcohol dehydrogenase family)